MSYYVCADVGVFTHYGTEDGLTESKINAIAEDIEGFIWIGTQYGLFKFNGIQFEKIATDSDSENLNILHIFILDNQKLLIGTRGQGLFIYQNNQLVSVSNHYGIDDVWAIERDDQNHLWLATDMGLYLFNDKNLIVKPQNPPLAHLDGKRISAIHNIGNGTIILAVDNVMHFWNSNQQSIESLSIDNGLTIHDLYNDENGSLWVASSEKLLRFNSVDKRPQVVPELTDASRILSIDQYKNDIWVATIDGGIYQIDRTDLSVKQYTHQNDFAHSLSEKHVMTIFISSGGILWAGNFSAGLNALDLNLQVFKFETNIKDSISCAISSKIYNINIDDNDNMWLGTDHGLVKWHRHHNECLQINQLDDNFTVYHTTIDNQNIWISSSIGLMSYHTTTQNLARVNAGPEKATVFFTHKISQHLLLLGTNKGLYQYHLLDQNHKKIDVPHQKFDRLTFKNFAINNQGSLFLATHSGILTFNNNQLIHEYGALNNFFVNKRISAISINDNNELFIGVENSGLYHLSSEGLLIGHYLDNQTYKIIHNILFDESNDQLWLSTDSGLINYDIKASKSRLYSTQAADNYLILNQSSYQDSDNTIYFGGLKGLIHFDPEKLKTQRQSYPLMFNALYLMNRPVSVNQETDTGFKLEKTVNTSTHLEFSHKDAIIGFEFIQLNYNAPKTIKYRYKLSPITSEWNPLPGQDRRLTFTNLKSGQYQLDIESTYFDEKHYKSLTFNVNAAPWFSWWAYMIYTALCCALIYFFHRKKIINEQKINTYLNKQVKQQTHHIEQQKKVLETQKKTVEELMARKNEIFSNVSHEFRTPITLILGPVQALQEKEKDHQKKQSFEMITRNAKRLLNLVNQMLKLAQISETGNTEKRLINLNSRITMITEPFIYLAKQKKINLIIEPIDPVQLLLTEDALETVVSNFLSNAIKHSDAGSEIIIGTRKNNDHVTVFVKDHGCGIDTAHQEMIFKRFNRAHQDDAQGVGIGLALVKELADLNQAQLSVISEIDQGSEFMIKFPIDCSIQNLTEQAILKDTITAIDNDQSILTVRYTVLIIEDNNDMREYINQLLSPHFNCLLAADGLQGIAIALKNVPDIIICDVMMPKIDGFEVCRRIRNDVITSHVPLVLLTAIDEKSSRIKGWRENIDRYLNKPFDAQELIIQLKNILNTRQKLLNGLNMTNNTEKPAKNNTYFSDADQQFIDKLKTIIKKNYTNPLFNLEKMASLMLISDRQLQRKIKALIDHSPMDLVREIRLSEAALMLTKGKQISYTSDLCGFSSVSYFSHTFKKAYGMTPKAYQKLNHKP